MSLSNTRSGTAVGIFSPMMGSIARWFATTSAPSFWYTCAPLM
jgi:hypothetical protein